MIFQTPLTSTRKRDARKRNWHLHLPIFSPIFSCRPASVQPLKMMAFCQANTRQGRPGHPPVATLSLAASSSDYTAASFRSSGSRSEQSEGTTDDTATQNQSGESRGNKGAALSPSNLSISGQILPAVDWMRCVKMIHGDNSGDSSSFAANLSPWCTGGGEP